MPQQLIACVMFRGCATAHIFTIATEDLPSTGCNCYVNGRPSLATPPCTSHRKSLRLFLITSPPLLCLFALSFCRHLLLSNWVFVISVLRCLISAPRHVLQASTAPAPTAHPNRAEPVTQTFTSQPVHPPLSQPRRGKRHWFTRRISQQCLLIGSARECLAYKPVIRIYAL
jgi:hypothetical protein